MANIIPLKDNTGAQFYPQTHEKAVVDSNGVNLQTKLASITTPTYVTAWDGDSTPVVANIPAGVTVTYNTTSYTGTLAASASTANKTYLVSTGTTDNYNRYVTQLNGSTYSWQNLGSTEIDLSDHATKEELGQLDQKVFEMQDTRVSTSCVDIPGVTKLNDYSSNASGTSMSFTSLNGYDTYYYYVAANCLAWLGTSDAAYLSIATIKNAGPFTNNTISGTDGVRKRKSESNLPTEQSPLSLVAGMAVAITITEGKVVDLITQTSEETFNGDIPLAPEHVEQVIEEMVGPCVTYDNTAVGTITEGIHIYIPAVCGFIEYWLGHTIDNSKDANIWGMAYARAVGKNKAVQRFLTTGGNWEAAIALGVYNNFAGGAQHGYEHLTSISFYADGAPFSPAALSGALSFKELRVLMVSQMSDPTSATFDAFAKHTVEYIWTEEGLTINQAIVWLKDSTVARSYLAMFPVLQAVTDKYCSNRDYAPVSFPSGGANNITIDGCSRLNIWSDTAKFFSQFDILKYPNFVTPSRVLITNNGQTTYNKAYYYSNLDSVSAAVGDVWEASTFYKLQSGIVDN